MKRLLVVIPAYNEEVALKQVISAVPPTIAGFRRDILVIDDGSRDNTSKIALECKVIVVKHLINRGLGATLATGFAYARNNHYDLVVTFDADGQHRVGDIERVVAPLLNGESDVVIGSRLLYMGDMPWVRRIVNVVSNVITYLLFSVWTTDSQSGLRAFTKKAIQRIHIRSQRMEVSSEIFKEISRLNLRISEVPIQAVYTDYSLRKGQKISNAPNVFWKLLLHRFT